MESNKACAVVDSITYKPGWDIVSMASEAVQGVVIVQIKLEAPNSASIFAPTYPHTIDVVRTYHIEVSNCTDDYEVYWLVLSCIRDVELHETREFFKVGDNYHAPFHPHSVHGRTTWREEPFIDSDLDGVRVIRWSDE